MANDTRSLDEIRRDTERARAGLTETVGQLRATVTDTAHEVREKYSPSAIKAEVSSYIKSRGEELTDGVRDSIRNNPVQAVAVGATLAYPLWKIVRAIPTPVLMIGAGLYLAGTRSGTELTQRASDKARDLADDLERRAREFSADAADTAVAAREYAAGAIGAASEAVNSRAEEFRQAAAATAADLKHKGDDLSRSVAHSGEDLRRRATATGEAFAGEADQLAVRGAGLANAVADSVREAAGQVRDRAADAATKVRETIHDTRDAGMHAAERLRDQATDFGQRASKTAKQTLTDHPLLVAGAGLLIGGLIASAFPRVRAGGKRIGRQVGERAREAAARGAEKGRAAYEGAAREAERQGLTGDNLTEDVRELGQRVRKVAEAAAASFEAPSPSQNKH
ncbi:hypothetical protein BJ123_107192 [Rhodopseudomonas thermotolerans]|uniref:Late embryogenesis abundant protein n=2 Tax=Rhodopseudomonas TaxID=1073 RepID=A0A336JLM7_9BRAD|nr:MULTISPECIES: hypothetical protein [Rhodopseudomonas]RED37618.1 hypothetical protein BJ125_107193 [Rhodopseudomonas pentothenatexigens]REG04104.1 hypothetical protein BJ123_107192 [Rhodopseudomonas thermotolerans]SSW90585.1 hypothetical protein SAMN05892882_107193 [Rhodopseudomonas pentothenatexigens]